METPSLLRLVLSELPQSLPFLLFVNQPPTDRIFPGKTTSWQCNIYSFRETLIAVIVAGQRGYHDHDSEDAKGGDEKHDLHEGPGTTQHDSAGRKS